MKKERMKEIVEKKIQALQSGGVRIEELPKYYVERIDGEELQFSEEVLEDKEEYYHIAVSVMDGRLSAFTSPVFGSLIISKKSR